jgi:hypothetical protein
MILTLAIIGLVVFLAVAILSMTDWWMGGRE